MRAAREPRTPETLFDKNLRRATPSSSMRFALALYLLVTAAAPTRVGAQAATESAPQSATAGASHGSNPDDDAHRDTAQRAESSLGVIIVVIENARRSPRAEAIRRALAERIEGSEVVGLGVSEDQLRAHILVSMHRDGSIDLRVTTAGARVGDMHVEPNVEELTNAQQTVRLAAAMEALLRTTEVVAQADGEDTAARHGLIPWRFGGGLRPYPNRGIPRVDEDPLLPWPESDGETAVLEALRRHAESASGLAAPLPRTQNR